MKKKMLILFILLILPVNVFSLTYGGCEYSQISRLKSLVKNINISYDYAVVGDEAIFNVTINNITPEMYFYDSLTQKKYYYSDTNNGEITIYNYNGDSGNYKFYSALIACPGINIGTKYYKFPVYNRYYNDPICHGVQNYSLCKKWVKINYSDEQVVSLINKYKESLNNKKEENNFAQYEEDFFDKFVRVYVDYYYLFLIIIIMVCSSIIIIKSRKDRFKL